MTAILEQLQGLVAAAEIPAGTLGVALILGLFGLMVVGLVLGQELAFVLGGAGVIVDAWPNTSLYATNTVIPAVRYDIPAGACELTTRVESWSR